MMVTITKMAAFRNGVAKLSLKFLPSGRVTSIIPIRSAHIGEPVNDPPVQPRQYQISRDPDEWKYVARLLNRTTVPKVSEKTEYPSGWVPPKETGKNQPYFVERSKNHQLSVYLNHELRGQLKITIIKRIHGDIWQLHDDVKAYVEEKEGKKISSQVLESNSIIKLKGDRFHWVEQFLLSKGF